MDGLCPFEFCLGIRRELGVVSALWGRLKGSGRNWTCIFVLAQLSALLGISECLAELQKRIVVSALVSALWAVVQVLAEKQKRIVRFCAGICVMGHFQGCSRKTDTQLLHRYLCCGAVAWGCAELHRHIVVSAWASASCGSSRG